MAISVSDNKKSSIGKPSQSAVRGGSNHMFGKSGSVPARPEALVTHGSGGGKWAKGGSGKMCGYSGVKPSKAL